MCITFPRESMFFSEKFEKNHEINGFYDLDRH